MTDKTAPAFPTGEFINEVVETKFGELCRQLTPQNGLTKREYAAIAAMQGLLANPTASERYIGDALAETACVYADELLAELEKDNG